MIKRTIMLSALILALSASAQTRDPWQTADNTHVWSWPRDLYAHREFRTEWWYFTGHLQPVATETEQAELGFQLTFFRLGMIPPAEPLPRAEMAAPGGLMAHAAVTDSRWKTHVFSETLWRETPLLAGCGAPGDSTLVWCRAPAGTDGTWRVTWNGRAFGLQATDTAQGLAYDLVCRPLKPVVLHGDNGFSAKNREGNAGSLYASFTRMEVTGHILRRGKMIAVKGLCWMDREMFTNSLAADQKGWDWVSLQLDDGRDLMLYRLFKPDGSTDHASGTLVDTDGAATPLGPDDWSLLPLETWRSPVTGAEYPIRWRLRAKTAHLDLILTATVADQENRSQRAGMHYWEGEITVTGGVQGPRLGLGYIEMTGYGKDSRPPI